MTPSRIVYVPIVADLFHYGHLHVIEYARGLGDWVVCGLITDEGVLTYRKPVITNFEERRAVLAAIRYVDEIIPQHEKDSTANLNELHRKYPKSKLILLHGDDWKEIPGSKYLAEIGGEVVRTPYYARLSADIIVKEIAEKFKEQQSNFEYFTDFFKINEIYQYSKRYSNKILSSKAKTLKALQPILTKSYIEKAFIFELQDWYEQKEEILKDVSNLFSPQLIVVRSSATNEDTFDSSLAGYYESILSVDAANTEEVAGAIERVIKSYKEKSSIRYNDEVLIQKQTTDVKCSGVVFTRSINNNAPYYSINFDDTSGSTESVTSGTSGKTLDIVRHMPTEKVPGQWRILIEAIREIESIIPEIPLDIEFGITKDDRIVIFQVRPIAVKNIFASEIDEEIFKRVHESQERFKAYASPAPGFAGKTNVFSDMAFWNPSEIIGDSPAYLDYSLYAYIITNKEWLTGLLPLGYKNISPTRLMVQFGNKPYIDVRSAFNALFLEAIPNEIQNKLISHFFKKLQNAPELHDKVEFDVHYTCFDFDFDNRAVELQGVLSEEEIAIFRQHLKAFTKQILNRYSEFINEDSASIAHFSQNRISLSDVKNCSLQKKAIILKDLLSDIKKYGTEQFSRAARLAFIAKTLLKSMVSVRLLSQEYYDAYMASITTVASEFSNDCRNLHSHKISVTEFMRKYGHLRPGSYNILSDRYDSSTGYLEYFQNSHGGSSKSFTLPEQIIWAIDSFLDDNHFDIDCKDLFDFISVTTACREKFKLEFTKFLSDCLEIIVIIGREVGLDPQDMTYLDISTILRLTEEDSTEDVLALWNSLISARKQEREINSLMSLPSIIFSEEDFELVNHLIAKPNFITKKRVEADVVYLTNSRMDVSGKVVLIECADPGFDWIFSCQIKGLITKYGGAASHMAIRCAEFQIPAAIGCGEIFTSLMRSKKVILDCATEKIFFA